MPKYAKRKDVNHNAIAETFESVGALVMDTSGLEGFVDMVILWRGQFLLCEAKDGSKTPSQRKLTPAQVLLHAKVKQHGGTIHVVETTDQALALLGARRSA